MFGHGSENVLGKIAALSARIRAIGAPSEQALYTRQSTFADSRTPSNLPKSASQKNLSMTRLEHDSASMIRQNLYSGTRS
jgi:hypothetical protein